MTTTALAGLAFVACITAASYVYHSWCERQDNINRPDGIAACVSLVWCLTATFIIFLWSLP